MQPTQLSPWVPLPRRMNLFPCFPSDRLTMTDFKHKTEKEAEDPKKTMERENLCADLLASKDIEDQVKRKYKRFLLENLELKSSPESKREDCKFKKNKEGECDVPYGHFLTGGRVYDRIVNPRACYKYQDPS